MRSSSKVAVCLWWLGVLGALGCGPQEPGGEGGPGDTGTVTGQVLGALPAPSRLFAIPGPHRVELSWPAVQGAVSYKIFSGTSSGSYQWSWTSTTNSTTDWADWAQLFYVVKAVNSAGEGQPSPEATATGWANVALHRPAAQSTNYDPSYALAGAAVDGNTDGNSFHGSVTSTAWSNGGRAQWWRVDLGANKSVYSMDLWNRTDAWSEELSNVSIDTSVDPTTSPASWSPLTLQYGPAGTPSTLDLWGVPARHVRLIRATVDRALMIAEVEIYGTPEDRVDPNAPTGLTATAASGPRVDLVWVNSTDNVGVKQYYLERCTGSTCTDFTRIAVPANTAYTYSDTAVAAGKTYRYRIQAQDFALRRGLYSTCATATTY
jgi:hypothetical protein